MAGVLVLYFGANFSCCNNYPPFMNNEEKIEHAKGFSANGKPHTTRNTATSPTGCMTAKAPASSRYSTMPRLSCRNLRQPCCCILKMTARMMWAIWKDACRGRHGEPSADRAEYSHIPATFSCRCWHGCSTGAASSVWWSTEKTLSEIPRLIFLYAWERNTISSG